MSIFISDHQKLLIRAQMFRNMQDTSILLIHLFQSFVLIILFDINFEVCLVKMGRKSLAPGINASHFKTGHLAAPPPPLLFQRTSAQVTSSGGNLIKEQNTLTNGTGTESFELLAMLSVASTSSQY